MATQRESREEILAGMDAAADLAKNEFDDMSSRGELGANTMKSLSSWWERWYGQAGHTRLAYILMGKQRKKGG